MVTFCTMHKMLSVCCLFYFQTNYMYHSVIHILQILGVDVNGPDAIDPAHVKLWQKNPIFHRFQILTGVLIRLWQ